MLEEKDFVSELNDEELKEVSGGFSLNLAPLKPKDRHLVNLKCSLCGGANLFSTAKPVSQPVEGVCIVCGKKAMLSPYEIG